MEERRRWRTNGKKGVEGKYFTNADGITIALHGLAGTHGRLPNPAVSTTVSVQLA